LFHVHQILLLVSLSFATPPWASPIKLAVSSDTEVINGSRGTPFSYSSQSPFTLRGFGNFVMRAFNNGKR